MILWFPPSVTEKKDSPMSRVRRSVQLLQEFSLPLIAGVLVALLFANADEELYQAVVHTPLTQLPALFSGAESLPGASAHGASAHSVSADAHEAGWEHFLTLHFLVNDLFMVLFFGIAAKEITEACLPGGALNPPAKAVNPLLGTLGGVLGPVGVFLLLNSWLGQPEWAVGWGIPTATDIALAWLVARFVFGKGHPAVSFLLLLAVADDAIGLGIIAFAYPDPHHPTLWANALWILPGMGLAWALRRAKVQNWVPYIVFGGAFSWWGLYSAHLHPALALVFIVPFLPGPRRDLGLFEESETFDAEEAVAEAFGRHAHSPLEMFEHRLKLFVDCGLFFFAFANAGVSFAGITGLTWIVLLALLVGKTVGITVFSFAGEKLGFPLPGCMKLKHLVTAGLVAGLGLTVALFVSGQAFVEAGLQGAAKMGALFSAGAAGAAVLLGWLLNVRDVPRTERAWLRGLSDWFTARSAEGTTAPAGQEVVLARDE